MTTNTLSIEVKTLRTKQTIPFTLVPDTASGKFTLLINEQDLESIMHKESENTKIANNKIFLTVSDLENAKSFPIEALHILPPELLAIFNKNSKDLEYCNDGLKQIMNDYAKQREAKEKDISIRQGLNERLCSSCEIGALNREFIPKLIKFFDNDKHALARLARDIVNTSNCEHAKNIPQLIENPKFRVLCEKYLEETALAKSNKGCTQCQLNSIKSKYNKIIKQLTSGLTLQETLSYYNS